MEHKRWNDVGHFANSFMANDCTPPFFCNGKIFGLINIISQTGFCFSDHMFTVYNCFDSYYYKQSLPLAKIIWFYIFNSSIKHINHWCEKIWTWSRVGNSTVLSCFWVKSYLEIKVHCRSALQYQRQCTKTIVKLNRIHFNRLDNQILPYIDNIGVSSTSSN